VSIKVQSYVWENSKAKGSALLLLLAIADHAHDDGDGAYPSVETLASKCRQSERNVQRLLRELSTLGEIVIRDQEGPHGCNVYVIPVPWGGAKLSGVTTGAQGVTTGAEIVPQMSPEPSLTIKESKTSPAAEIEKSNDQPNPCSTWESIGLQLSPYIAERLKEFEKDYTAAWLNEAIRRAARQNKRNIAYVEGILKRWLAAGWMDVPPELPKNNTPIVNTPARWVST
jgi:DnaD/phage-associated family protein